MKKVYVIADAQQVPAGGSMTQAEIFRVRFKLHEKEAVDGKFPVIENSEVNNLSYEEVKDLQAAYLAKSKNRGVDWFEASLIILES